MHLRKRVQTPDAGSSHGLSTNRMVNSTDTGRGSRTPNAGQRALGPRDVSFHQRSPDAHTGRPRRETSRYVKGGVLADAAL